MLCYATLERSWGIAVQETICLYLDLKSGEKADFEVIGLTAAAFAETVKEIAFILDPLADVRLEFDSADDASVSLNAVFKAFGTRDGQIGTVVGVIIGTSIAFVGDARQWGVGRLLDHYFPQEQVHQLSQTEITAACKGVTDGKVAREPIQKIYQQLDRDSAIESVGTITKRHTKPPNPVPRSDFEGRAGALPVIETSSNDRTVPSTERLTLISPVLLPANRAWRFLSPFGEDSYTIQDKKFLQDVLKGRAHLTLRAGIQITARIDTLEKFEGGVWIPKHRTITRVIKIHRSKKQEDLFSQKPKKPKGRPRKKK
jgi:hypothetical protein